MNRILLLLFMVSSWSSWAIIEQDESYLYYLKLKRRTFIKNIRFAERANYIPKDVIWDEKSRKALVVPRPNPFKKVYLPESPLADRAGMVKYPNVELNREQTKLQTVEKEISTIQ